MFATFQGVLLCSTPRHRGRFPSNLYLRIPTIAAENSGQYYVLREDIVVQAVVSSNAAECGKKFIRVKSERIPENLLGGVV